MAKSLIHMIPGQEAMWNKSAATTATGMTASTAAERHRQYQQQQQQSSSSSTILSSGNLSGLSKTTKSEGHEVARTPSIISTTTASQSSSNDTVTVTTTDYDSAPLDSNQQHQQQVSTKTDDQVLLAIAEIESYIDLTRQHSSITNEEMPFLTKPATPYVPLPKEDDVFLHQEEKKEDPFNSNERVSVATNDQIDNHKDSPSILSVLPFTSLPVVDEADEEGEEVVAPSELIGGTTCTNDKPALPSNHGGRLRIEGLFGLSVSSLHANNKVRRASAQAGVASSKNRKTVGKVSVQQDGSTRHDDVEMIPQQESTSKCTDSMRSVSSAVVSQNLPRVLRQPTTPLSRSYESLEAMRSSLRAKVSVANSSPDVFEVVAGELVSTNITSPSEALSRRTSSKMTPASVVFSQAGIGVDDAMALATLKRVVSTSPSATTTDEGIEIANETEQLNILRATSSFSSAGGGDYQSAIPFESDVKVEELEDTIELTRTRTIRPVATLLTHSFEEIEEPLQIHVENHDDSIELLRTRTEGSWQAEEYEPSVHSSAITVPTTKFSKEFVRTLYLSGSVENLRSARVINQDNEAIRVLSRDMAKESAARVDGAKIPVSIDDKRDYAIEVQRPGSSSSMFSRNAPFRDPSATVEKDILITALSGPNDQSIRSGTSPKQKKGCFDKDIAEVSDKKNFELSDLQEGTQLISLEEETRPLSDPAPESKNIVESNISKHLRINGPASAFFQDENPAPSQQPLMTDETIKLAPPEANIAVSIPKIPAPRNDTTSMHDVGAMLEQSLEIASRRKRLHFKSQEQKKAAVSEPNDSKTETKAIASAKEGVEVAPEEDFPDPFLCTPEHMVHVNVLGIAGIVVDRAVCGTDYGQKAFPTAPEGMKIIVGMTERGSDQIIGVTASSKTLIPSPNGMIGGTKHRHVAVWVSDNDSMTPGSPISSDLITMERVDPENPKSRYKPRFFDLTVALAKDTHVAIPIGVAKLKVNGDFVNHGELVTMDLPVYTMEQSQNYNEMNAKGGEMSPAIQSIKLKNKDTKKSGIKSMFQRKSLDHESDGPTQEERKALLAAYGIDPAGDSMIRVQVRVETLGMDKDGEMKEKHYPSSQTVATEPTEDGSLESSLPGNKEDDTAGGKVKKELIDKAKPRVVRLNEAERTVALETIATESLYSKPLLDTTGKVSTSGPCVAISPTNTKMGDETFQLPICGKSLAFPTCGSTQELSKEQEIKQVGGKRNDSSHTTTSVQGSDDNVDDTTVEEDDSVPIQDGSLYASLSDIGGHVSTGSSTIGPVPTVDEIKAYLKEQFGVFVLKSGEFFFPEDPSLANDDISSIGDATLEAFVNGQLRMRTMDSGTWQKSPRGGGGCGDDDSRTCDSVATPESEPTLMLQPFGDSAAKGKTNKKKKPMATVEEEAKPVDPPAIKRNSGSLSKSQRVTSQLEGENENENDDDGSLVVDDDDDDDDTEKNNDGDDEMSLRTPRSTKRGSSHSSCNNSQSSRPKSVAESLAESLVGVLSRYPMCGGAGYGMDPKRSCSKTDHRMKIPRTVDPDVMSVGDLTAATLEEHHHHHHHRHPPPLEGDAAAPQRAGNGGSRSRLKMIDSSMFVSSLRSAVAASGWFVCGSTDNVDDSVLARRRSTPIQFTASGSSAMLKVSTTNSMLDHPIRSSTVGGRGREGGKENYFAEYEEEEEHLEESDVMVVVIKEERRVDPPADRCCTVDDESVAQQNDGGMKSGGSVATSTTTTTRTAVQQEKKSQLVCTNLECENDDAYVDVDDNDNDTRVLLVHQHETDEC